MIPPSSQLKGCPAHDLLKLTQLLKWSEAYEAISLVLPRLLHLAAQVGLVNPSRRQRGADTRDLGSVRLAFPAEKERTVMADFIGEAVHPSSDVFVKEVRRVMIDGNPVQPAPNQAVLVSMERLEDFIEIVWGENLFDEDPSLLTLAVPSPGGVFLGDAVMDVHGEVPVPHKDG